MLLCLQRHFIVPQPPIFLHFALLGNITVTTSQNMAAVESAPKRQRRISGSLVPLPLLQSQLALPEPIIILRTVLGPFSIRHAYGDVLRNLEEARRLLQYAVNDQPLYQGHTVPPGETIMFEFAWPTDNVWRPTAVDRTVPFVAVQLSSGLNAAGKLDLLLHHDLGNGHKVDAIVSVNAVVDMLQQVTRQMLEKARQRQAIAQEVHEAVDSSDVRSLVGSYLPYSTNRRRLSKK